MTGGEVIYGHWGTKKPLRHRVRDGAHRVVDHLPHSAKGRIALAIPTALLGLVAADAGLSYIGTQIAGVHGEAPERIDTRTRFHIQPAHYGKNKVTPPLMLTDLPTGAFPDPETVVAEDELIILGINTGNFTGTYHEGPSLVHFTSQDGRVEFVPGTNITRGWVKLDQTIETTDRDGKPVKKHIYIPSLFAKEHPRNLVDNGKVRTNPVYIVPRDSK